MRQLPRLPRLEVTLRRRSTKSVRKSAKESKKKRAKCLTQKLSTITGIMRRMASSSLSSSKRASINCSIQARWVPSLSAISRISRQCPQLHLLPRPRLSMRTKGRASRTMYPSLIRMILIVCKMVQPIATLATTKSSNSSSKSTWLNNCSRSLPIPSVNCGKKR